MIPAIIYGVMAILAIMYPGNPVPNEALMYLLICNIWVIWSGKS